MNLNNWSEFNFVEDSFLKNVKHSLIFGETAFLITNDDDCFSVGSNEHGALGIGSVEPYFSTKPLKIPELCKKNVTYFSSGSTHMVALTEEGKLYSWGSNTKGELGHGDNKGPVYQPCMITSNGDFKEVACGTEFTVALNFEGEVYACGANNYSQVGNGCTTNQLSFVKLTGGIESSKISNVCCGTQHTAALSATGEIFIWGYGGAIGLGNSSDQSRPVKLSLNNVQKVVCASLHVTFALLKNGQLFGWGNNSASQIGNGNTSTVLIPTRVAQNLGQIYDVSVSENAVSCKASKVYIWGAYRGKNISAPRETKFIQLTEAACYSRFNKTLSPIILTQLKTRSLVDDFEDSIDNEETSDVQFEVEGKLIYAHTTILRIRCEYFRKLFSWNDVSNPNNNAPNKKVDDGSLIGTKKTSRLECPIKVEDGIRYEIFRAFLVYLYTDKLGSPIDDVLDLLKLANFYCQDTLRGLCEKLLQRQINEENVVEIYTTACKHNAKQLEKTCFDFMVENFASIALTESYKCLETVSKDELVVAYFSKIKESKHHISNLPYDIPIGGGTGSTRGVQSIQGIEGVDLTWEE